MSFATLFTKSNSSCDLRVLFIFTALALFISSLVMSESVFCSTTSISSLFSISCLYISCSLISLLSDFCIFSARDNLVLFISASTLLRSSSVFAFSSSSDRRFMVSFSSFARAVSTASMLSSPLSSSSFTCFCIPFMISSLISVSE